MMKVAAVSIIVPFFNAENRIKTLLNCIGAQTFADYEVILIDDGSSDKSLDICRSFSLVDSRFRVFHRENGGVASARNFGLQKAKGEFVAFLDADDEIPEDYLEKLTITQKSFAADITVCDVAVVSDGKTLRRFTYKQSVLSSLQALDFLLSRENINSGPCAKLFRRSLIASLQFPPLKAYEDILFVTYAFEKAQRIAITDKTEYRYIQNSSGAMSAFSKAPSMDIITATAELADFIKRKKTLSPSCMYATMSHLMQYVQMTAKNKDRDSEKFRKAARQLYRKNFAGILRCKAFPQKEKVFYTLFAFGFIYR